jgi:hypothetical protein
MQSLEWVDDNLLGTASSGGDGVSAAPASAPISLSAAGRAGSLALSMRPPEPPTGLGPSPLGPGALESYVDVSSANGSKVNGDSPGAGAGALSDAAAAASATADVVRKMSLGSSGSEGSGQVPMGAGGSGNGMKNPPRTLLFRTTAPVLLNVLHTLMASSPSSSTSATIPGTAAAGGLASSSDAGGAQSILGGTSNTTGEEEGVLLLYLGVSSLQTRLKAAQVKVCSLG